MEREREETLAAVIVGICKYTAFVSAVILGLSIGTLLRGQEKPKRQCICVSTTGSTITGLCSSCGGPWPAPDFSKLRPKMPYMEYWRNYIRTRFPQTSLSVSDRNWLSLTGSSVTFSSLAISGFNESHAYYEMFVARSDQKLIELRLDDTGPAYIENLDGTRWIHPEWSYYQAMHCIQALFFQSFYYRQQTSGVSEAFCRIIPLEPSPYLLGDGIYDRNQSLAGTY